MKYFIGVFLLFAEPSLAQFISLQGKWKFIEGNDTAYKEINFNDAAWELVNVPAPISQYIKGIEKKYCWYRTTVIIPRHMLGGDLILFAGTIDDCDETYFNGVKIGGLGKFPPNDQTAWDRQRQYLIPQKLLKEKSMLAIKVYNGAGDGGIYGGKLGVSTKKYYDRELKKLLDDKHSYHQLTTSNGLIAAVYNEESSKVEAVYPHIFSFYDSAIAVHPVLTNLSVNGKMKPISSGYFKNTHVIEVKYPAYSLYYFSSFVNGDKIFYITARGNKAAIDKLDFGFENAYGKIQTTSFEKKYNSGYEKYFLFGFTDSLHFESDAVFKAATILNSRTASLLDAELHYMKKIFTSCKFPTGISEEEKTAMEQSIAVLKMSQVSEKEIFPLSHGQILASLRPGIWSIAWVRDASFSIAAMSKIGMKEEAAKGLEFMLKASPTNQYIHFTHSDGMDHGIGVPYIISVTRYFGKGREESDFGETNGPNIEIDDFGLFFFAFYEYMKNTDDELFYTKWNREILIIADAIVHSIDTNNLIKKESGPWEHHLPGRQFTWTSGVNARALQMIAELQKQYHLPYTKYEVAASRLLKGINENLIYQKKFIKGNVNDQNETDHYFCDAATFELFANGLLKDKNLFSSHMAYYDKQLRAGHDSIKGYIRFNSNDSYENQEWPFAGLRVAVAQSKFGNKKEAKKLIDRVTVYASRNFNTVPEILSIEESAYKGAIPMVGYGSAAWLLALLEYYKE
jgi:GH15 family glucan-1,4-alpha-glucosidase